MISHALPGDEIIVAISSLENDHVLHPIRNGVELAQQTLRLVTVAGHTDPIMGMDQIQAVLNGAFLLLIQFDVVLVHPCFLPSLF
jgi:hypothetical protein